MAAEYGFIKPTGKVITKGYPTVIGEYEVETATNMYPGRLVMQGSTTSEIVVNDTSDNTTSLMGYLGYEHASDRYKPDTVSTIYVQGDAVPVLRGSFAGLAYLRAQALTVTVGEGLMSGVDGTLMTATICDDQVIATALGAVTTTTAELPIWVWFKF